MKNQFKEDFLNILDTWQEYSHESKLIINTLADWLIEDE